MQQEEPQQTTATLPDWQYSTWRFLLFEALAGQHIRLPRFATGHLVHGSRYHLGLDLAAWVLAVSAVFIDAGFLYLQPELAAYCGLSGILNGIMAAGALALHRSSRFRGETGQATLYFWVLVGILGKIAVEGLGGAPLFSEVHRLGATPVPLAHALGALGAVLTLCRTRLRPSRDISIYA